MEGCKNSSHSYSQLPWFKIIQLLTLFAYIISTITSSTNFGVIVYVVGFLDPSIDDPISCTNLLPNPNSNGYPFADPCLLTGTCNSDGLNTTKGGCVSTLSICNPIACRFFYVYYCYCCCYCK